MLLADLSEILSMEPRCPLWYRNVQNVDKEISTNRFQNMVEIDYHLIFVNYNNTPNKTVLIQVN